MRVAHAVPPTAGSTRQPHAGGTLEPEDDLTCSGCRRNARNDVAATRGRDVNAQLTVAQTLSRAPRSRPATARCSLRPTARPHGAQTGDLTQIAKCTDDASVPSVIRRSAEGGRPAHNRRRSKPARFQRLTHGRYEFGAGPDRGGERTAFGLKTMWPLRSAFRSAASGWTMPRRSSGRLLERRGADGGQHIPDNLGTMARYDALHRTPQASHRVGLQTLPPSSRI